MTGDNKPAAIVDNRSARLAEEVRKILPKAKRVRIATGYFYANGFQLLADRATHLSQPDSVQVILGLETDYPTKTVLEAAVEDRKSAILRNIREELFSLEETSAAAAYLQQLYDAVHAGHFRFRAYKGGVFHPKCYIFDTEDSTNFAYVGSSNFTRPGLNSNLELNILTKEDYLIDPLRQWFDTLFSDEELTEDLREGLLQAVESTPIRKRHQHADFVTPWEMLLCVAAEFLRQATAKRSDFLAEFQQTGVFSALKRIEDYGGCIVADSVGLGKSFIGAAVMETFHRDTKPDGSPYRVLALVPAHLKEQWTNLLQEEGPSGQPGAKYFGLRVDGDRVGVASQGVFATLDEKQVVEGFGNFDLIVVDEAHRFRNDPSTVKRVRLLQALKDNPQRAKEADAVKFVFLTATPLNNSVRDLKNLISLCTLRKGIENRAGMNLDAFDTFLEYFNREHRAEGPAVLTDPQKKEKERAKRVIDTILREVMILRTREFLQNRPGGIVVGGRRIEFSRPIVRAENYQQTNPKFEQLVQELPDFLEGLAAPHIVIVNPNAGAALAGLYKIHLLKRLESSPYAFWQSLQNYLNGLMALEAMLQDRKKQFEQVVEEYARGRGESLSEEGVEEVDPNGVASPAAALEGEAARESFLAEIRQDRERILGLIADHFDGPNGLRNAAAAPFGFDDNKVQHLAVQLAKSKPKKVLVFTQYADTAEYLLHHLTNRLRGEAGATGYRVGMATGNACYHPRLGRVPSRRDIVWCFSPSSNERRDPDGKVLQPGEDELDVLIATDSLSEGVNLQECRFLVNYDLPWNPTRIVQRVGRIDRIVRQGQPGQNEVMNLVSPDTVESELGLLETLQRKSTQIAMFVAKEYGIVSSAEETAIRTYGHDLPEADLALIRDRITRLQRANADELERLGRNPLLEGVIQEDENALWRLSLKALLDEYKARPEDIKRARGKFPETPPRFAYFHGPDPGVFLFAQVVDFKRGKVREDLPLWYSLRTGDVVHVDPGNLGISPTTSGFAAQEVPAEQYGEAMKRLVEEAEAALQRHKDDAAGLTKIVETQHPPLQRALIPRLKQFLASDTRARTQKGVTETSPIPDEIRNTFRETANWLIKNVLTNADDKELRDLLGPNWAKLSAVELHARLHPFHLAKMRQRQDYRIGTVRPEDLTLKVVCGGVSLAQAVPQ